MIGILSLADGAGALERSVDSRKNVKHHYALYFSLKFLVTCTRSLIIIGIIIC